LVDDIFKITNKHNHPIFVGANKFSPQNYDLKNETNMFSMLIPNP
jgi:hypothetical protein